MPDANSILSYTGNKDLAFGSTALPSVATDFVADLTPGIKAWADFAANKLLVAREREAQLKRKQLQAQKDFSDIDPSKYKFWYKDNKYAYDKWREWRELAVPVMQKGNWENVDDPDYLKAKEKLDSLIQDSQYSMQQEAHHTIGDSEYKKSPKDYLPTSQASLDAYANAKSPKERAEMDYTLDAKIGFDLPKYVPLVLNRLKEDNPTLTAGEADQYNNVQYTHQGELNVKGATDIANSAYASDPDAPEFGQHLIDTGQSQAANPKDAFVENFVQATVPQSLHGEIRSVVFSPYQKAAATQEAKPQDSLLVDFFADLQNPESDRYVYKHVKGTKEIPNDINVAPSPSPDLMINGKEIGAFINKDGKIYAIPKANWIYDDAKKDYVIAPKKDIKTGKFIAVPLIPVDQVWSQVLQPYIEKKYTGQGSEKVGQDVQNYAIRTNQAEQLGIPMQQGTKQTPQVTRTSSSQSRGTQTGEVKYILKGYGNFTHKQLIDAGYTEDQIKQLQVAQ